MTQNVDPDNGIAYGYISAQALRQDVVMALLYYPLATDLTFEDYFARESAIERRDQEEHGNFSWDDSALYDRLRSEWTCEEPIIEGEIDVDGYGMLAYRSSWCGGALHFFILKSPFITDRARTASPCVQNAGILDTLDGSVTAYDVPADWRAQP